MKRHLLYLLTSFLISSAFGQADFQPGFIVTLSKDTVRGQIESRSHTKNYISCLFKKDEAIKEYTPAQLLAFGYDNDSFYRSGIIPEKFVEVLVDGDLSLYRFNNFYVQKSGDAITRLEETMDSVIVQGETMMRKNTKWKGIISYFITDCHPGTAAINSLTLTERKLIPIVTQYNECKKTSFRVYKKTKKPTTAEVALSAGISHSTVSVNPNSLVPALADKYNVSAPTIGIILTLSSPRMSDRMAFQAEVHFSKYKFSELRIRTPTGYVQYDSSSIDLTTLSFPIGARYLIANRRTSLYALASINYDMHLKTETRYHRETYSGNFYTTDDGKLFDVNKNQIGLGGGLMLARTFGPIRTSLIARYFMISNFSTTAGFVGKTQRLAISLQIGKSKIKKAE
jgi:hypothetical protein